MVEYIKLGSGVEINDDLAKELCDCLEKDGVIALPTDTVSYTHLTLPTNREV